MSARRAAAVAFLSACTMMLVPNAGFAQVPSELVGHITDARTGAVISGAHIEVSGQTVHAESNSDGSFLVRGLEPHLYDVRVHAVGYAPHRGEVEVVNGRATTLDIALLPIAVALQSVVIRSARDTAVGGATIFDRRAIETSARRDLGELLEMAPGVVITQAGGPGAASSISIRGSSANEVLVLVDGVPINSVIAGTADLSRIALGTVDRVTVLPGAQSARYGSRALAGVVLIETRHADQDASLASGTGAWGERNVRLAFGDIRAVGALAVGASVAGDYRTLQGDFPYAVPAVRGGGTAQRLNADATSRSVLASTSINGISGALRLRAEWESTDRGLPGSTVQPSTTGRESDARLTGGFDGHWERGRFLWTMSADLTHEHAHFDDATPPFGGAYDDVVDAHGVTLSTSGATPSPFGLVLIGGEARTLDVTSTTLAPSAPSEQRLFGTWANLRSSRALGHDMEITGDLSARLDWDSFTPGATASPHAALTVSHGPISLSTSAGQAYAPPSLGDQFFHEGVLVRPNPDLQPERVREEIETRVAMHDVRLGTFDVSGDVAAYRANVDGMIVWLPDYRFVWSPSNINVRRTGWDASARVAAPAIGIDLQGRFSQSDVTYAGSVLAGQVAYRPRTTAMAMAGVTHWGARLEISNRYVGARRTVAGSALNQLDPYWLTDAKFSVPLVNAAWTLDAVTGVANVFNRSTAMLVDYPFPGRSWTVALRARRAGDHHRALASPVFAEPSTSSIHP